MLSDVFFQKSVLCLIFLFLFFSVSRCWHTAVSKNWINQILSSRNYERLFHGNLGKWKTKTIQVWILISNKKKPRFWVDNILWLLSDNTISKFEKILAYWIKIEMVHYKKPKKCFRSTLFSKIHCPSLLSMSFLWDFLLL